MSKFAPHRRGINNPVATSNTVCQKCLAKGHYTYECKSSRPYVSRPSRTELLEKPKLLEKLKNQGKPSVELPEEFKTKTGTADKILEAKERARTQQDGKEDRPKKKPRRSSRSSSESSSSSSSSESDSSNSASESESSGSSSDSSRSRSRDRRRRRPTRRSPSSGSSPH